MNTEEKEEIATQVVAIIQRDFHLVHKKKDFNTNDKNSLATNILALVCSHFDIDPDSIATKSCKGDLVRCRFIFYYLADKYYPMIPDTTLGRITGRASNTVMSGILSVKKKMKIKKDLQDLIGTIEGAFLRERNSNDFYKNITPITNDKENDNRPEEQPGAGRAGTHDN